MAGRRDPGVVEQVTVAGRVRAGDRVLVDGRWVDTAAVRRAPGRKPPGGGDNLHLVTAAGETVRVRSLDPVRVRRHRGA